MERLRVKISPCQSICWCVVFSVLAIAVGVVAMIFSNLYGAPYMGWIMLGFVCMALLCLICCQGRKMKTYIFELDSSSDTFTIIRDPSCIAYLSCQSYERFNLQLSNIQSFQIIRKENTDSEGSTTVYHVFEMKLYDQTIYNSEAAVPVVKLHEMGEYIAAFRRLIGDFNFGAVAGGVLWTTTNHSSGSQRAVATGSVHAYPYPYPPAASVSSGSPRAAAGSVHAYPYPYPPAASVYSAPQQFPPAGYDPWHEEEPSSGTGFNPYYYPQQQPQYEPEHHHHENISYPQYLPPSPESQPQPQPQRRPRPQSQPKPKSKPQTQTQPQPQPQSQPKPKSKQLQTQPRAQSQPKPKAQHQPVPVPVPVPAPPLSLPQEQQQQQQQQQQQHKEERGQRQSQRQRQRQVDGAYAADSDFAAADSGSVSAAAADDDSDDASDTESFYWEDDEIIIDS